jgi:hypothetical protein
MTDRNRATTLRLRTPAPAPSPANQVTPRAYVAAPSRLGAEPRRTIVQSFVARRVDPTSQAILAELAELGLAEPDDSQ